MSLSTLDGHGTRIGGVSPLAGGDTDAQSLEPKMVPLYDARASSNGLQLVQNIDESSSQGDLPTFKHPANIRSETMIFQHSSAAPPPHVATDAPYIYHQQGEGPHVNQYDASSTSSAAHIGGYATEWVLNGTTAIPTTDGVLPAPIVDNNNSAQANNFSSAIGSGYDATAPQVQLESPQIASLNPLHHQSSPEDHLSPQLDRVAPKSGTEPQCQDAGETQQTHEFLFWDSMGTTLGSSVPCYISQPNQPPPPIKVAIRAKAQQRQARHAKHFQDIISVSRGIETRERREKRGQNWHVSSSSTNSNANTKVEAQYEEAQIRLHPEASREQLPRPSPVNTRSSSRSAPATKVESSIDEVQTDKRFDLFHLTPDVSLSVQNPHVSKLHPVNIKTDRPVYKPKLTGPLNIEDRRYDHLKEIFYAPPDVPQGEPFDRTLSLATYKQDSYCSHECPHRNTPKESRRSENGESETFSRPPAAQVANLSHSFSSLTTSAEEQAFYESHFTPEQLTSPLVQFARSVASGNAFADINASKTASSSTRPPVAANKEATKATPAAKNTRPKNGSASAPVPRARTRKTLPGTPMPIRSGNRCSACEEKRCCGPESISAGNRASCPPTCTCTFTNGPQLDVTTQDTTLITHRPGLALGPVYKPFSSSSTVQVQCWSLNGQVLVSDSLAPSISAFSKSGAANFSHKADCKFSSPASQHSASKTTQKKGKTTMLLKFHHSRKNLILEVKSGLPCQCSHALTLHYRDIAWMMIQNASLHTAKSGDKAEKTRPLVAITMALSGFGQLKSKRKGGTMTASNNFNPQTNDGDEEFAPRRKRPRHRNSEPDPGPEPVFNAFSSSSTTANSHLYSNSNISSSTIARDGLGEAEEIRPRTELPPDELLPASTSPIRSQKKKRGVSQRYDTDMVLDDGEEDDTMDADYESLDFEYDSDSRSTNSPVYENEAQNTTSNAIGRKISMKMKKTGAYSCDNCGANDSRFAFHPVLGKPVVCRAFPNCEHETCHDHEYSPFSSGKGHENEVYITVVVDSNAFFGAHRGMTKCSPFERLLIGDPYLALITKTERAYCTITRDTALTSLALLKDRFLCLLELVFRYARYYGPRQLTLTISPLTIHCFHWGTCKGACCLEESLRKDTPMIPNIVVRDDSKVVKADADGNPKTKRGIRSKKAKDKVKPTFGAPESLKNRDAWKPQLSRLDSGEPDPLHQLFPHLDPRYSDMEISYYCDDCHNRSLDGEEERILFEPHCIDPYCAHGDCPFPKMCEMSSIVSCTTCGKSIPAEEAQRNLSSTERTILNSMARLSYHQAMEYSKLRKSTFAFNYDDVKRIADMRGDDIMSKMEVSYFMDVARIGHHRAANFQNLTKNGAESDLLPYGKSLLPKLLQPDPEKKGCRNGCQCDCEGPHELPIFKFPEELKLPMYLENVIKQADAEKKREKKKNAKNAKSQAYLDGSDSEDAEDDEEEVDEEITFDESITTDDSVSLDEQGSQKMVSSSSCTSSSTRPAATKSNYKKDQHQTQNDAKDSPPMMLSRKPTSNVRVSVLVSKPRLVDLFGLGVMKLWNDMIKEREE